jgi:hypothetical protein
MGGLAASLKVLAMLSAQTVRKNWPHGVIP